MLESNEPQLPPFYGRGDDDELDRLESLLESMAAGSKGV